MLHAVEHVDHLADLGRELLQQTGEDDQPGTQRQLALDHQVAAVAEQQGEIHGREKFAGGGEQAQPPEDELLLILQVSIGAAKFVDFGRLAGKPADYLHAAHVFGQYLQ